MNIHRKGSMQLSIEAIIILVIAIVLLGLGIAFIKNFFGQGSSVLIGQFDPLKEGCNVNDQTPMVPLEFEIKQGSNSAEKICVYNNGGSPIVGGVLKIEGCTDPNNANLISKPGENTNISVGNKTLDYNVISIASRGLDISRGKSTGYKTTFAVSGNAPLGMYICNLYVQKAGSATEPKLGPFQATITVS